MSVSIIDPHAISTDNRILRSIEAEDCSLAVWQRDVPVDVQNLLIGEPDSLRISVPTDRPESLLRESLDNCNFPDNDEREQLTHDIVSLCQIFGEISAMPSMEIRLEIVTGKSCWKFHSDYVQMRLITTYLGRGTQWIDARDADRLANGMEPKEINELGTGDVGLFKGRIGPGRAVIHRSPPIKSIRDKRLLLVLNPQKE